jgi:hypothetical protein
MYLLEPTTKITCVNLRTIFCGSTVVSTPASMTEAARLKTVSGRKANPRKKCVRNRTCAVPFCSLPRPDENGLPGLPKPPGTGAGSNCSEPAVFKGGKETPPQPSASLRRLIGFLPEP